MGKDELIMKVAQLISEGKEELVEEALQYVEERENEDSLAYEAEEETEGDCDDSTFEEIESHCITQTLDSLSEIYCKMGAPILTVPFPTPYGIALVTDFRKCEEKFKMSDIRAAIGDRFGVIPARIFMLHDEEMQQDIEVLQYFPSMDEADVEICIMYRNQPVNLKYGYVLPVIGMFAGLGCASLDLADMNACVHSMMNYLDTNGEKTIVFPELGCKVVKPDGTCKGGREYSTGTRYFVGGDLIPHKNGIHYATDPEKLKGWYKNDYTENAPMIIQPDPDDMTVNGGPGIRLTNHMIVLREITWDNVEELLED